MFNSNISKFKYDFRMKNLDCSELGERVCFSGMQTNNLLDKQTFYQTCQLCLILLNLENIIEVSDVNTQK